MNASSKLRYSKRNKRRRRKEARMVSCLVGALDGNTFDYEQTMKQRTTTSKSKCDGSGIAMDKSPRKIATEVHNIQVMPLQEVRAGYRSGIANNSKHTILKDNSAFIATRTRVSLKRNSSNSLVHEKMISLGGKNLEQEPNDRNQVAMMKMTSTAMTHKQKQLQKVKVAAEEPIVQKKKENIILMREETHLKANDEKEDSQKRPASACYHHLSQVTSTNKQKPSKNSKLNQAIQSSQRIITKGRQHLRNTTNHNQHQRTHNQTKNKASSPLPPTVSVSSARATSKLKIVVSTSSINYPTSSLSRIKQSNRIVDNRKKQPKAVTPSPTLQHPSNNIYDLEKKTKHNSLVQKYAYFDSKTKELFMYVTADTTNAQLCKIFNEQKRRSLKKQEILKLYKITFHRDEFDHDEIYTEALLDLEKVQLHQLDSEEETPLHANTGNINKYLKNTRFEASILALIEQSAHLNIPFISHPNISTLHETYASLAKLLGEDCENFHSVKLANAYYEYWKPKNVKVILLAESHVSTPEKYSSTENGPIFNTQQLHVSSGNKESNESSEELHHNYNGPINFCSLVYCLSYGEHGSLIPNPRNTSISNTKNNSQSIDNNASTTLKNIIIPKEENAGTWQFWNLFSACISDNPNNIDPSTYGKDVQKSSKLSLSQRIQRKHQILCKMKQSGIWLLDTSIIGWYIQQATQFDIAKRSKQVTKLPSWRPHPKLKTPCLRISWEGYIKHVIQKVAREDDLQLLIPIGKDVEAALGKKRLLNAVGVDGKNVKVLDAFPAPNARVHGGYKEVLKGIACHVHKATANS